MAELEEATCTQCPIINEKYELLVNRLNSINEELANAENRASEAEARKNDMEVVLEQLKDEKSRIEKLLVDAEEV